MFWLTQINNGRQMVADTVTLPKLPKEEMEELPYQVYQDGFGLFIDTEDFDEPAAVPCEGGVVAPQYICASTLKNDSDEPLTAFKVLPSMRFKVPFELQDDAPVVGQEVCAFAPFGVAAVPEEVTPQGHIIVEDVDPLDKAYELTYMEQTVDVIDVIVRIYPPVTVTLE